MAPTDSLDRIFRIAGKGFPALRGTVGAEIPGWKGWVDRLALIPRSGTAEFLERMSWEVDGEYLVFASRAQHSVLVGLRVEEMEFEFPAVYVSENAQPLSWRLEFRDFRGWLETVSLWSLVNDGRGVVGYAGSGGRAALKRLAGTTEEIARSSEMVGVKFLEFGERAVLCFAGKAIYAWAEDSGIWCEVEKAAKIRWDYCSLTDA